MASVHDSYLGLAEESAYGAAVAPSRFVEMVNESLAGDYQRIESEAWRAGQRTLHKDRFVPNPKGANGDIQVEAQDAGFGLFLKHTFGVAVSGEADVDGWVTHTFTVGDLDGKSLTVQVGRGDASGSVHPFTYTGGKIATAEFANAVDGVLNVTLGLDFAAEHIGAGAGPLAVATPTYPEGAQLFSFVGGSVDVDGVPVGVSEFTFRVDNSLKTDRWLTTGKREPTQEGQRGFELSMTGEFDGLAHAQRVAAALAVGTLGAVVLRWSTPQGGELSISLPFTRFDGPAVGNFDAAQLIEQPMSGRALWDGSTSPVIVTYKTRDIQP